MTQKIPNRVILPLKKYHLDKIKVLDVGCGFGEYLQFFGEGSMGIDIREKQVEETVKRGLKAVLGDIEQDSTILPKDFFDAAWLSNVLEHVNSPHKTLAHTALTLKEGGLVFVKIPLIPNNIFGFLYKKATKKKNLGYKAATHLYAFNRKTAEFIIERAGFEIIESSAFFPPNILHKVFDFLFKDMATTITIVARKKS